MTKKPAVTILGCLPPDRGISAYCLEQARAMADLREVQFIAFRSMYPSFMYPGGGLRPDHTFPDYLPDTVEVRRKLAWYSPFSWVLEGLCAKGDPLHVHFWSLPLVPIIACVMMLVRLRRGRCVVTVHNVHPHEPSVWFCLGLRLVLRLSDAAIVHCDRQAEELRRGFRIPWAGVHTVPHGPLDVLAEEPVSPAEARKRLGLPEKTPILLFFGSIRPYKGLDVLLRAMAQVIHSEPTAHLVIAGKLWESWQRYQDIVDDMNLGKSISTFLDYIPANEVKYYFAASNCVVLPYLKFDAQSGVALTALAFNRPVVVSDVGGLPDLASETQEIVPPGDAEALAETLHRVICDQTRREESQLTANYQFMTWEQIANRTIEVYECLDGLNSPTKTKA